MSLIFIYSYQVELEKLYDKHDKTQMELRKAHGELEKFKSETAALEAEVDRFAGRIGKYQENEDKLNEDLTRYNLIIKVIWIKASSYFLTNHYTIHHEQKVGGWRLVVYGCSAFY